MQWIRVFGVLGFVIAAASVEAAGASRTVTVSCQRDGGGRVGALIEARLGKSAWKPRPDRWQRPLTRGCTHPFTFRMEVVPEGPTDGERSGPNGQPLILVRPDTTYSIRLYNPLPVRAGVTLSVDGLNTLTGKPGGASSGAKWIIEPHGTVTISGWQTGSSSSRRFVFTGKHESYAAYRSDDLKRDLTVNSGVIGAAFFWNARELEGAIPHYDRPFAMESAGSSYSGGASNKRRASDSAAAAPSGGRTFDAGTGMGEHMVNPVRSVSFDFTAGMYSPGEALAIYYDFAGPGDTGPRPFEDGHGSFAPEMPQRAR